MRNFVIAFVLFFTIYIITSNAMPNFLYNLTQEESEAYEACVRLKTKAPYINLRCERLKEASRKNGEKLIGQGIKLLSSNDASTRKVDKIQERKLRNLLIKLASENILRKD